MNQAAIRWANQPNDWDRMHFFLATFHQKEYCFECQWWMMRSNHVRLIQNILNHIKWRLQFPSFLSILWVLDWLIVGFILIGRQLPTCSTHSILFSLLASKEVSYLPVFSSLHSMVWLQVPEWHVGSHSYGKSPVTSSNKSCRAFRMVVLGNTILVKLKLWELDSIL